MIFKSKYYFCTLGELNLLSYKTVMKIAEMNGLIKFLHSKNITAKNNMKLILHKLSEEIDIPIPSKEAKDLLFTFIRKSIKFGKYIDLDNLYENELKHIFDEDLEIYFSERYKNIYLEFPDFKERMEFEKNENFINFRHHKTINKINELFFAPFMMSKMDAYYYIQKTHDLAYDFEVCVLEEFFLKYSLGLKL